MNGEDVEENVLVEISSADEDIDDDDDDDDNDGVEEFPVEASAPSKRDSGCMKHGKGKGSAKQRRSSSGSLPVPLFRTCPCMLMFLCTGFMFVGLGSSSQ